jgi:hypothetical protein
MSGHDDFEREAEPGLPQRLPPDERVIWRGAPDWRSLARRAFHVRKVAGYFAILGGWFLLEAWHDGNAPASMATTLGVLAAVAATAIGLLTLMAWLSARETVYTITNRRVVVRFGVALRLTLNVPFTIIDGAGVKVHADGTGDLPLTLRGSDRVSYAVLWPHARPWHLRRPEIMLRCIPEAEQVAGLLSMALARRAPDATKPTVSDYSGQPALT